jgi:hypothetical protein
VIDTVPAVINVKDKDLRYVLMNHGRHFGIEPQDAIGPTTADLMSRWRGKRPTKTTGGLRAGSLITRSTGFHRQYAAVAGQLLPILAPEARSNIVTVALDIGDRNELEMRKAARRSGSGAGNLQKPELADRAEKTRRPRRAGGRRRARGQQSRRYQPDGGLQGCSATAFFPPRSRAVICAAPR